MSNRHDRLLLLEAKFSLLDGYTKVFQFFSVKKRCDVMTMASQNILTIPAVGVVRTVKKTFCSQCNDLTFHVIQ